MRLSLRAIELCRRKFGKGIFWDFEQVDEAVLDQISEENVRQDFDELTQNGIIEFAEGNVHISALGQHIFNMMLAPEQYIKLDNEVDNICVRVYIRNTYYLCVIEDRKIKSDFEYDRYQFELLPRLDLVVGAFVYALHRNEEYVAKKNDDGIQDIQINGKAWNKDREIISDLTIDGNYHNKDIHYKMIEQVEGFDSKMEESEIEESEFINIITKWMFEKISVIYKSEV